MVKIWCHDNQQNDTLHDSLQDDTLHDDTLHDDTLQDDTLHMTQHISYIKNLTIILCYTVMLRVILVIDIILSGHGQLQLTGRNLGLSFQL